MRSYDPDITEDVNARVAYLAEMLAQAPEWKGDPDRTREFAETAVEFVVTPRLRRLTQHWEWTCDLMLLAGEVESGERPIWELTDALLRNGGEGDGPTVPAALEDAGRA